MTCPTRCDTGERALRSGFCSVERQLQTDRKLLLEEQSTDLLMITHCCDAMLQAARSVCPWSISR